MNVRLKKTDIGKSFRTRRGDVVRIKEEKGWHPEFPYYGSNGVTYRPDGTCLPSRRSDDDDIVSTLKRTSSAAKKSSMKYFVGKLSEAKHGSAYRIFRQRKSLLGNVIDEMWTRDGWKRMKKGYAKVGIFLNSQAAVRAEKLYLEKQGAW